MKTKILRFILSFAAFTLTAGVNTSFSQSYKDIMNKGIDVKPESNMYLRYDGASPNQVLKYNFTGNTVDFKTLDTTYYFIAKNLRGLNVYIEPINPLNSKTVSDIFHSTDQIQAKYEEGIAGIIKSLNAISITPNAGSPNNKDNVMKNGFMSPSIQVTKCEQDILNIIDKLTAINSSIAKTNDKEINSIFEKLEKLDFARHSDVKSSIKDVNEKIISIEKHYSKQDSLISELEKVVNDFSCNTEAITKSTKAADAAAAVVAAAAATEAALAATKAAVSAVEIAQAKADTKAAADSTRTAAEAIKLAFADNANSEKVDKDKTFQFQTLAILLIDKIKAERSRQLKRLKSISDIKNVVEKTYNEAIFGKDGTSWYSMLKEVPITKGKISHLNVKLSDAGFNITGNDIIEIKESLNKSYTIKFRKFQRFIPEVSSGIAYVNNITFRKYGTSLDETTDKYVVTDAGEEEIRRFNLTTMINFYDYKYAGEDFFPYLQLGAGTNLETPAVFLGGGFNFFGGNLSNLSISAGGVGLFRKELNDLEVGDVITGTAELEQDLSFQPKIRWYFSLQWHLATL